MKRVTGLSSPTSPRETGPVTWVQRWEGPRLPASLEALVVAALFVAPGLGFELGIERQVGFWRTSLVERTLRFFLLSVLFHALVLPITLGVLPAALDASVAEMADQRWALWGIAVGYLGLAP